VIDLEEVSMQEASPKNPFLYSESVCPIIHFDSAQTDSQPVGWWARGDHEVTADELDFVPLSWASHSMLHRRYRDGSDVLLVTGNASAAKLRVADDRLELVGECVVPSQEQSYAPPEAVAQLLEAMDAGFMDESAYLPPFVEYATAYHQGVNNGAYGVYSLLDLDGHLYAGYGTSLTRFTDSGDGGSSAPLEITGTLDIKDHLPAELAKTVSRFLGINMTYDGFLVVAMPGVVAVVSRDLSHVFAAPMPGEAIDNGICLDDDRGVYVVTSAYMRKLVWTGSQLSVDEADGAWKEPYPYVTDKPGLWLSRGAGATPTCMGFGPDEDHLVVLSDAGDPVKVVAFWRDEIPSDTQPVDGVASLRTASAVKLDFPIATTIEWSAQVCRDGVLMFASDFPDPAVLPGAEAHAMQTTLASMGYTREGPRGAQRFRWNTDTKTLEASWLYTDRSMAWTLSPVSSTDDVIYLNEPDRVSRRAGL
jgi:hypothetical protein